MPRSYLRYEPDSVFGLVCSQPGGVLAAEEGVYLAPAFSRLLVWDLASGTLKHTVDNSYRSAITAISAHPDRPLAFLGFRDGSIAAVDYRAGEAAVTLPGHRAHITCLSYDPESGLLLSGSADGDIRVWDVVSGSLEARLPDGHGAAITGLVLFGVGEERLLLSSAKDRLVVLWNLRTREKLQILADASSEVRSLALVPVQPPPPGERPAGGRRGGKGDPGQGGPKSHMAHKGHRGRKGDPGGRNDGEEDTDGADGLDGGLLDPSPGPSSALPQGAERPLPAQPYLLLAGCEDSSVLLWATVPPPPRQTPFQALERAEAQGEQGEAGGADRAADREVDPEEEREKRAQAEASGSLSERLRRILGSRLGGISGQTGPLPAIGDAEASEAGNAALRNTGATDTADTAANPANETPFPPSHTGSCVFHFFCRYSRTLTDPVNRLIPLRLGTSSTTCNRVLMESPKLLEAYELRTLPEALRHGRRRFSRAARYRAERVLSKYEKLKALDMDAEQVDDLRALLKPAQPLAAEDFLVPRFSVPPGGGKVLSASVGPAYAARPPPAAERLLLAVSSNVNALSSFALTADGIDDSAEISLPGHRAAVQACCLNREDTLLATVGLGELKVWAVRTCACLLTVELPSQLRTPTGVAVAAGNRYAVVSGSSGALALVDLGTGEVVALLAAHEKAIRSVLLFRGGVVTASEDGYVRFWSFATSGESSSGGAPEATLIMEREFDAGQAVTSVLATDKLVFAALADNTVRIHFTDTLKFKGVLYGHALTITGMALSYSGEKLVTCSLDKTLRVWGLQFGECQKILRYESAFTGISLIRDTHLALACSKDGRVTHWDLDSFLLVSVLGEGRHEEYYSRGHFGEASAICVSSTGRFAATVGMDRLIHLWLQTDDLVSAELEGKKRLDERVAAEAERQASRGPDGGAAEAPATADARDTLEEAMAVVHDAEDQDPRLLGLERGEFLLQALKKDIRPERLDDVLFSLPGSLALQLLSYLVDLLERRVAQRGGAGDAGPAVPDGEGQDPALPSPSSVVGPQAAQPGAIRRLPRVAKRGDTEFLVSCTLKMLTRYFRGASNYGGLHSIAERARAAVGEALLRLEDSVLLNSGSLLLARGNGEEDALFAEA